MEKSSLTLRYLRSGQEENFTDSHQNMSTCLSQDIEIEIENVDATESYIRPTLPGARSPLTPINLLQRNEPRTVRGPDPRPAVLDRLIGNTELPQIMPDHLRLDFHLVEFLARINANYAANHLRNDNHVAQMGFDQVGLLVGLGFLFGFAQFFDQAHWFAFEAAVEASAGAGVHDVAELFGGEVEESGGIF